jgi:hypothetical protein
VGEAAVQLLLEVEVVERVDEVSPIKVGIDTEHLPEDGLANIEKIFWKTTSFSDPVTIAGTAELRERRCSYLRVVRERNAVGVRGEDVGVINLARDPALHQRDIFVRRKLHRFLPEVKPSEGVITDVVS